MRRRAFTLIEMMVVCTVLLIVAALIIPNVVAMKAGQEKDEAYRQALRLAQQGRENAIRDGLTYTLSIADNGSKLVLQKDKAREADADPRQSILNGSQSADQEDAGSVTLPQGVTTGNMDLDGKASNASDFQLHFYPDGHSEGGGLEWIEGGTTRSLLVTTSGVATLKDGSLPQASDNQWEAGTYEQRSTGS